jgi:hypothetical protein
MKLMEITVDATCGFFSPKRIKSTPKKGKRPAIINGFSQDFNESPLSLWDVHDNYR